MTGPTTKPSQLDLERAVSALAGPLCRVCREEPGVQLGPDGPICQHCIQDALAEFWRAEELRNYRTLKKIDNRRR